MIKTYNLIFFRHFLILNNASVFTKNVQRIKQNFRCILQKNY